MNEELNVNKIAAEVITDLAKSTANNTLAYVKKAYKDKKIKGDIDYGDAYIEYINNARTRYEKIKTLLFRQTPQNLYSFYECVGVSLNRDVINTESVNNIMDIGNKIIITGTGGIGKTIMMKHFFLDCIKETRYIPVLIELRGLNDKEKSELSILDFIYEVLQTFKFNVEKEYFEYSMEAGCYLIIFDGYDEVKGDISKTVTKEIIKMTNKYPDNYYIMSSRPSDEFIGWNDFVELEAMPLTKEQALSLINRLEYDSNIKDKFYQALDEKLYDKYESFASNPLLLTIMLITFESNASIPDKLNDFYEKAFSALFDRHDATKEGFIRDIKSNLGYEDFKKIFSYICFKSFYKSQYEFTESQIMDLIEIAKKNLKNINNSFSCKDYLHDLTNSVCMLVHEGLNYRFSHRSFQEYFAALHTTLLDDDTQTKLIVSWIKELRIAPSVFLAILYDLQSDRVDKNIFIPVIIELRDKFEKNNYTKQDIFEDFVDHILLDQLREKDKLSIWVSFKSSHQHYVNIMKYLKSFNNGSPQNKAGLKRRKEVAEILHKEYNYKKRMQHISLTELKTLDIYNMVVDSFVEFFDRIDFSFEYLKKYEAEVSRLKGKRKLDSILEQL